MSYHDIIMNILGRKDTTLQWHHPSNLYKEVIKIIIFKMRDMHTLIKNKAFNILNINFKYFIIL